MLLSMCVCLFMHNLCKPHHTVIKWIMWYMKGTFSTCLHLGTGQLTPGPHIWMHIGLVVLTLGGLCLATASSTKTI